MQRSSPPAPTALPWHPAAGSDVQRSARARQRFFGEGVPPAGQVPDAVWHSWQRCLQSGLRPEQRPAFEPVSRSKVSYLAGRDHVLLKAARRPFDELQAMVARSRCKVLLADRDGVLLRVTPAGPDDSPLVKASCRTGVHLGELLVGTTAPTVAARTGANCAVGVSEHFYDALRDMRCVAAPIRNRHGVVVAVLDLSIESQPFGFDALWLVQAYAGTIENNLRIAQTRQQVLLRLHSSAAALQTPGAGLAAVDEGGRISWLNGLAAALVGVNASDARQFKADELLGCSVEQVLARSALHTPQPLLLPNGLTVWMQAEYRDLGDGQGEAEDDARTPLAPSPAAAPIATDTAKPLPSAATLAQLNRQLIDLTLAECHGNVSQTARRLGVSRGLLYRRLREDG
ncbi:helix-turn-helix domain-containing protein [Aquabacterium sp.]|uniref:helix-turn-helix domain-containing protein n=1 Tax=Aquabacterium sp. TaxID=1872578 RepID=UPI002C53A756|nr:helix-turn-helix domain-containing protein [Aquabacterium sp.]HSW06425.1 helix-turn-helix domain-containing protein [Aquabacterium sp.]